jgi:hypothetical protein
MEPLGQDKILAYLDDQPEVIGRCRPGYPIAASEGHSVCDYPALLRKVAALSYHNPRFKLLFRGQRADYKVNRRDEPAVHSSLYPSILRSEAGTPRKRILQERFARLSVAEQRLEELLRKFGVRLHQLARWAILQHYEICSTPLLDVTQSLQTALSFALADAQPESACLFVFAFPLLNGPISISIESMTQVIDLSQVCPPQALRPHFQAGVLVGDYPALTDVEATHGGEGRLGNNFAARLLAKFRLLETENWSAQGFAPTARSILFPDEHDDWFLPLDEIRRSIDAA